MKKPPPGWETEEGSRNEIFSLMLTQLVMSRSDPSKCPSKLSDGQIPVLRSETVRLSSEPLKSILEALSASSDCVREASFIARIGFTEVPPVCDSPVADSPVRDGRNSDRPRVAASEGYPRTPVGIRSIGLARTHVRLMVPGAAALVPRVRGCAMVYRTMPKPCGPPKPCRNHAGRVTRSNGRTSRVGMIDGETAYKPPIMPCKRFLDRLHGSLCITAKTAYTALCAVRNCST